MKITIAEFAKKHSVSHSIATGFILFLVETGRATKTDEIQLITDANGKLKRGRPSFVFEMPETMNIKL